LVLIPRSSNTVDNAVRLFSGYTTPVERFAVGNSEAAFNDPGNDYDFRVESDSNTHMLFVDAGNNRVGINHSSPSGLFEIQDTSSTVFDATDTSGQVGNGSTLSVQNLSDDTNSFSQILLRTRNASKSVSRIASLVNGTGTDLVFVNEPQGSDPAERFRITKDGKFGFNTPAPVSDVTIFSLDDPVLTLRDGKSGSSWVAGDGLGQLEYYTSDGTGIADHAVARIKTISGGANSAGPDGVIVFETAGYNSTPTERFRLGNTDNTVSGAIFNEGGYNQDFRVESSSNSHMLFVDASGDHISIGTSADYSATLNIDGNVRRGGYLALSNFNSNNDVIAFNYNIPLNSTDVTPIYSGVAAAGGSFIHMESGGGGTLDFRAAMHGTDAAAFAYTDAGKYLTLRPTSKSGGELVVNQDGDVIDFRVESDSNANMLFVDGGNNRVGVGLSSLTEVFETYGSINTHYQSSNFNAGVARTFLDYVPSLSKGRIGVLNGADASTETLTFIASTGTTNAEVFQITPTEFTVNEGSSDIDFRVESNSNNSALFVDAGNDRVGILDSAPVAALSVAGDILRRTYNGMNSNTIIGTADATSNWYQIANQGDVYIQAMSSFGSGVYQQSGGNIYIKAGTPYSNSVSGGYVTLQSRANALAGSTRPHVLIKHESTSVAEFDDREAVFNEDSNDIDFRVESDSETNAIFVDAGSNYVEFGNEQIIHNNVNIRRVSFSVPASTNRRVRLSLSNYHAGKVIVQAQRTNSGNSFVYWEGFVNENDNAGYSHAVNTRTSGGSISYTFTDNGDGTYDWDFNNSGSPGTGSIMFYEAAGDATITVTTY
jgi:hypothetical protein